MLPRGQVKNLKYIVSDNKFSQHLSYPLPLGCSQPKADRLHAAIIRVTHYYATFSRFQYSAASSLHNPV
jgi:hypothetical protein